MEELNKELRQCNLQQFIQQAGALPTPTQPCTDLSEHPEQLDPTQQQDQHKDSGMTSTHTHTLNLLQVHGVEKNRLVMEY